MNSENIVFIIGLYVMLNGVLTALEISEQLNFLKLRFYFKVLLFLILPFGVLIILGEKVNWKKVFYKE